MKKLIIGMVGIFLFLVVGILIGSCLASVSQIITQKLNATVINGTDIVNGTISHCIYEQDNVELKTHVVFNDCQGNVWISININESGWTNYTVINHINSLYWFTLNSSLINGGDIIYWQYFAKDCYGLVYNGSINNFYVIRNTNLIVNPAIPNGDNGWYITEPEFTLENLDNNSLWYRWDSTGNLPYLNPFGLEDIPNNPPLESAGTLELNYWANTNCSHESEQTKLFYIDLKNPEIMNLEPANNSEVKNIRPMISAYLDEVYQSNSGINETSIIMKINGQRVNFAIQNLGLDKKITYAPLNGLTEGIHQAYVYVKDNSGRESQATWNFYVNKTSLFDLIIYSPLKEIYDSRRIFFNLTTSKEVEKIEYINWNDRNPRWRRLCINCEEYGFDKKRTKTLGEGENKIGIRATHKFESVEEVNISFFVDSRTPKISKTEPRRNAVINGSKFYIKYTEDNLQNITLFYIDGGIFRNITKNNTECLSGKNQECVFNANLTDYNGLWTDYWFEIRDKINTKESRVTRVFVDVVSPNLTIYLPQNAPYDSRRVQFNMTASEDVNLYYIDNNDKNPRWRKLCTRCDEYGFTRNKIKSFKKGVHNLLIEAVDKAGNSDIKEINFEVDY